MSYYVKRSNVGLLQVMANSAMTLLMVLSFLEIIHSTVPLEHVISMGSLVTSSALYSSWAGHIFEHFTSF